MRDLSETEADSPDTTPLQLGRPVRCSDGPVGHLSDVVIDPNERRITHVVVEDPNGAARLVPAELLVQGWAPGLEVVLSCSSADVSNGPTIRSFSYVGLEAFPENDERSDVGVEDLEAVPSFAAVELAGFGADMWTSYAVTYDRIPPGSAELRRGSIALSADEDEIGRVDGFLLAGTRLTHVVLSGPVTIPVESVTTIATDRITAALPSDPANTSVDSRWLPLA